MTSKNIIFLRLVCPRFWVFGFSVCVCRGRGLCSLARHAGTLGMSLSLGDEDPSGCVSLQDCRMTMKIVVLHGLVGSDPGGVL